MTMKKLIYIVFLMISISLEGQVSIGTNTPHSSAKLDLTSTSKGVLIPRMTQTQMAAISSPATGSQIYNTTKNCIFTYNGVSWTSEKKYIGTFANAGDVVELDNIRIKVPSTGNKSIQIATVSGTFYGSGSSINNYVTALPGTTGSSSSYSAYTRKTDAFSTSYTYWENLNFTLHGSTQVIYLMDETNSKAYKITCMIGYAFSNNYLEIEQLQ